MRVALVYDRVNKWGGAERLLLALHEIWPKAPLYTAVYDLQKAPWAKVFKVIPSFLNRFPLVRSRHETFPYLMPLVFESFDFTGYDLVISITSEAAKGIITKPVTIHLCYCLTPTRYLWAGYEDYFQNKLFRFLTQPLVAYLRGWDKIAAQRPDFYFAISKNVQERIRKYYGRDSEVIYPPVDTKKWRMPALGEPKARPGENGKWKIGKYFLIVSRLVTYKRIEIAVEAFNQLGWPLKIIGVGNQMSRLKKVAKRNIEFLGWLTDKEVLGYYQKCLAVIFPQEEDLGLVSVEAQACGKPVIAFRSGGAEETIIEGKTGVFFYPQTVKALVKALRSFRAEKFKPMDCCRNAERFNQARFKREFKKAIEEKWTKWRKN